MEKIKQLSNLRDLPENLQGSALVLLDFLDDYKGKFEAIEGVLSEIKSKEVKTYTDELKTLHEAILSLVDSVSNKDTIVNIPLDKLSEQLVKVETAIKNIKEVKIPDFPEFPEEIGLKDEQINQLLVAIETIPDFPMNELKSFIDKLSKELFKKLDEIKPEAQEKIDYEFFYDAFKRLEKAVNGISISVSGGGGDTSKLATEETLQDILANQGNINSARNTVVSTYLDKFRDDFYDLSNWDVVQVGSGMSYELRGVANGSRFLAINSGTTSGEETILKAKSVFTVPFKIAFGASVTLSSDTSGAATSGRQTNLLPIFEIVECDDDGNVVETGSAQTYSGLVPNCMAMVFDGTTVTTQRLVLRSSGNSEWQAATAMGTYSSTTPSGSWPNYIQVGNQIMITNNEFANYLSERADTTTTGTNIKRNTSLIDPTKKYTIRIRLKNNATVTPADFNIHMVRVMDASRVSVDFGLINGSYADAQQAIPVYSTGGTYVVYENPSTSYGNAFYHTLISDASINAKNIKATTCLLTSLNAFNRADYSCFLKTYSKATVPNPATDTPTAIYTLRPGNNDLINLGRYAHRHTLGLSYIITKNPDLTDTTPIAAGDVILNISYA